jgi:uroporphyrinogen-III decarboxylase
LGRYKGYVPESNTFREQHTPTACGGVGDWDFLKKYFHQWQAEGRYIEGGFWFGFDVLHSWMAGTETKGIKRDYGDRLVLHGGTNAMLMDKPDKVLPYIEDMLPVVKENGGYIFSSDHSIPNSVSLENYRAIVAAVKKFGAY